MAGRSRQRAIQGRATVTDARFAYLTLLEAGFTRGVDAHALVSAFGGAAAVMETPLAALTLKGGITHGGARSFDHFRRWFDAEKRLEELQTLDIGFVCPADPAYPSALRQIPHSPLGLYFVGDLSVLDTTCIALVGAREASPYGLDLARNLGQRLAEAGVCVVSGMARGVDAAAHWGALAPRGGRTAAVLGCGLDVTYPRENRRLREQVAKRGCVLTEYPPGTQPLRPNFPRRNRILSGLSRAVVVVEATTRSGSLITAGHALDQGRDVFAVPGDVGRPLSKGTNALLKEGAIPCTEAGDVLGEYGISPAPTTPGPSLSVQESALLDLLEPRGVHGDWLAENAPGLEGKLDLLLAGLVTKGLARRLPGNRYARSSGN